MIELGAVMQVLNSLTDILSRKIRKSSVRVEDRMLRMDQYAVIEKCKTNGIVALAVHWGRFVEEKDWQLITHPQKNMFMWYNTVF